MVDIAAIKAAYEQFMEGAGDPTFMTIWCERCQVTHYASSKSSDICAALRKEIEEAQACRNS